MIHLQRRLRTRLFTMILASQFKEFGSGSRIEAPFTFWGLNQISVADKVYIQRDCWIHVVEGYADAKSVKITLKSHASIGKRTAIAAARQVIIGEYVMIGSNCHVSDQAHAFNGPSWFRDVTTSSRFSSARKPGLAIMFPFFRASPLAGIVSSAPVPL